ncbi:MAG: response regulator, partial [Oscillospiraceae bacterium]|nr:response regulator [Oscillospiraceae bacterium]
MEVYRVLLVDDEEEIREGIRHKINWMELGFELAGFAADGIDALELAQRLRPDVVLTDIKMPRMDGLELCRRLKSLLPETKTVVLSGFDEFECARQAVGLGVFEYLLKPIRALELGGALERLRERLDRERQERREIESLRRRYEESLPILRELFYTRLLDGRIPPGQVADQAARYGIELAQGCWTVALVLADAQGKNGEAGRDELSIQSFFQRRFSLEGCALRAVPYNDMVALLVHMRDEGQIDPLTEELGRLCALAAPLLGMTLFVGVGRPCPGPELLHES